MVKVLLSSLALAVSAFAIAPTAHAREFGQIYTDCGLGAMLFPNNKTVAVITNITFDLGTTAVISNASSPNTCKGGQAKTAMYIHESYEALASDLTRGNGKYLSSLVALTGADATQLRSDFAQVVASSSYSEMSHFQKSEALYNLVVKNPSAKI